MRVVFADSQLRAGQTEESALIPLDRFEQVSVTQERLSPGAQNMLHKTFACLFRWYLPLP